MIIDRPFRIAMLFSIGLHSVLFSPLLGFISHPIKSYNTNIEVTYINIKEKELATKPIPIEEAKVSLQKERKSLSKDKEVPKHIKPKEPKEKKISKKREPLRKPKSSQKKIIKMADAYDRAIDLSSISFSNGWSDSLNYLHTIRNKINLYVHRNYDVSMGEGEAVIHFVLKPDGTVQSASIIRDSLGTNNRLRKLCLDSIYRSSPFKSFPKDLDLPQAAFNICISFNKK